MHQATQKRPCGNHHRFSVILDIQSCLDAGDLPVLVQELRCLALLHVEIRLALADPLQPELISFLIALRPRRPNGRTFLGVQHPKLQTRHIGRFAHLATQRIDLSRQMAFS